MGGVPELGTSVRLSGERRVGHADEDNVVQVQREELQGDLVLDGLLRGPQGRVTVRCSLARLTFVKNVGPDTGGRPVQRSEVIGDGELDVGGDELEEDDKATLVVWKPAVTLAGCEPGSPYVVAGLRRSPETQSFDCIFEQSGRQPLRKDISFVELWLLVHDPTVIRGKRLTNDARNNSFGSQ